MARGNDRTVQAYIEAAEGQESEAALVQLLHVRATPVVRGVLRGKLKQVEQDFDDLVSRVLVLLLGRLRALKADPSRDGIADFEGYVAETTRRAYFEHLRRLRPGHYRFKRKLRRLLRHDSRFAVWQDEGGHSLCGLAHWPQAARPKRLREELSDAVLDRLSGALEPLGRSPVSAADRLHAAFEALGAPVKLDLLVALGVDLGTSTGSGTRLPSGAGEIACDPADQIEARLFLRELWQEVMRLPVPHRTALLLNLRGRQGTDLLALFPWTGTAPIREIAGALEMAPEALADLWRRLPLDDRSIADRLGVTRQQVINYRSSARRRLARCLRVSRERLP